MPINTELANDIRTVVSMIPGMHDQEFWFEIHGYGSKRVTPEDIKVFDILAETKAAEAEGKTYRDFELQTIPSCDATLCLAGWACILNGYTLEYDAEEEETFVVKDDKRVPVDVKGRELLGIDEEVADWLFCETNDEQALDALDALAEGNLPGHFQYEDSDYCCEECDGY